MGIEFDLNRAIRIATMEVVKFLAKEKRLTQAKALSLASIAVDFRVAEAVDGTQVVTGNIPKSLFLKNGGGLKGTSRSHTVMTTNPFIDPVGV